MVLLTFVLVPGVKSVYHLFSTDESDPQTVSVPVWHLPHVQKLISDLYPRARYCNITHDRNRLTSSLHRSLVLRSGGRMGNVMFQAAALYGIARCQGLFPRISSDIDLVTIFPRLPDYTELLNIRALDDMGRLVGLKEEQAGKFSPNLMQRPVKQNTHYQLCCYLQSYKYFSGLEADILQMFQLNPRIQQESAQFLDLVQQKMRIQLDLGPNVTITYVGMHVRRGEGSDHYNPTKGYQYPKVSYYRRAMDWFRTRYQNVVFIVCSDDRRWVQAHIVSTDVYYCMSDYDYLDLATLTRCNHTIMSIGTFGWWAGFLAQGQVVYYRDFIKPGSDSEHRIINADRFLPHWTALSD